MIFLPIAFYCYVNGACVFNQGQLTMDITSCTAQNAVAEIVDNLSFRQVILEFYTPGIPDSGWVHVSYNPGDNKKQVLTATKQGGKTVYLQGLVK
jgi:hypothetical protein